MSPLFPASLSPGNIHHNPFGAPMRENTSWHSEVIAPEVAVTAERLGSLSLLRSFYLAGGTALALYLGHRRSVDLDFFSPEPFNEDAVIASLHGIPDLAVISKSPQTVYVHASGTKVSFIGYQYPLLFPFADFRGFAVAGVQDIACMKLSALASRGSRRDFVDLYVVAREYGIPRLLDLFQRKYAQANYNLLHIRKSLAYFADAEQEPMPHMLVPLSWEEVKRFFLEQVRSLM
jgi:predicted nucleotidyltransferase component of viral defense system